MRKWLKVVLCAAAGGAVGGLIAAILGISAGITATLGAIAAAGLCGVLNK